MSGRPSNDSGAGSLPPGYDGPVNSNPADGESRIVIYGACVLRLGARKEL